MIVQEHIPLKSLNSFALDVKARWFTEPESEKDLTELRSAGFFKDFPFMILGGGSNVLFMSDFPGLIVRMNSKGVFVEKLDKDYVYVRAMAGVNWPDFVEYCVQNEWGGIENLTLIPGNVGTSPMQNIGAYGVELKDTFSDLHAWEIATGKIHTFYPDDCRFGYRDSFFKKEGKGKYIILSVCFRLTTSRHRLITHYGSVHDMLTQRKIAQPGLKDVMAAIQWIRRSKLPDPVELGNAGSFFKNPVLTAGAYHKLKNKFPELPSYEAGNGLVKTAAGWLIEKAGWKGYREGDAGVHQKQALVLVNYGNATGEDIFRLSEKIKTSVFEQFGIQLEREVNIQ